jgi:hypothetical protein
MAIATAGPWLIGRAAIALTPQSLAGLGDLSEPGPIVWSARATWWTPYYVGDAVHLRSATLPHCPAARRILGAQIQTPEDSGRPLKRPGMIAPDEHLRPGRARLPPPVT